VLELGPQSSCVWNVQIVYSSARLLYTRTERAIVITSFSCREKKRAQKVGIGRAQKLRAPHFKRNNKKEISPAAAHAISPSSALSTPWRKNARLIRRPTPNFPATATFDVVIRREEAAAGAAHDNYHSSSHKDSLVQSAAVRQK
jgi:hypothetical protein